MALILWLIDRPNIPNWLVVVGFLGPGDDRVGRRPVLPGAQARSYRSFQVSQTALGPDGKPIINPQTGQKTTELAFSLANYQTVFTDPSFQKVLINTVWWVILVPVLATAFGLIYAVLVDRTRGEKVAKALVFLPMAISMVGASIIWKFMYEYRQAGVPQIGLLNQILVWLGLDPYQFIITEPWNTFFLIVVMIWIQAGFAMTVLSAAIKSVPDDIVEAAQIDGATGFKLFRKVTVPTIRPAVVVVLTTIAMGSLKAFDIVRTMTGGNFGTSVVANEFYTQSFRQGEAGVGIGAALAVDPVHHHHPGHRLQRAADAAFGGNAMSMSGSAVELPITTDATPEEKLSPRQLKKQTTAAGREDEAVVAVGVRHRDHPGDPVDDSDVRAVRHLVPAAGGHPDQSAGGRSSPTPVSPSRTTPTPGRTRRRARCVLPELVRHRVPGGDHSDQPGAAGGLRVRLDRFQGPGRSCSSRSSRCRSCRSR